MTKDSSYWMNQVLVTAQELSIKEQEFRDKKIDEYELGRFRQEHARALRKYTDPQKRKRRA